MYKIEIFVYKKKTPKGFRLPQYISIHTKKKELSTPKYFMPKKIYPNIPNACLVGMGNNPFYPSSFASVTFPLPSTRKTMLEVSTKAASRR
jgi:hypothetical protein